MKSAYGRQTSTADYELTCVKPGSPMGELTHCTAIQPPNMIRLRTQPAARR
jgi:hypothetical protein